MKGKKSKGDKKASNGKAKEGEEDSSSELSPNTTDTDSDAPAGTPDKKKSAKLKDQANRYLTYSRFYYASHRLASFNKCNLPEITTKF